MVVTQQSFKRTGVTVPTVSVIVPALNEAKNLPHVLARICQEYEIVLVDGRSSDDTVATTRRCRPDAKIVTQDGRGKGNALICGFAAASGEILVMLDADGSTRPEEIPAFVEALSAGADFAKGSRFLPGGGSADITLLRRAGNATLGMLVNQLFRTRYTDLCYGFNAFWRCHLPAIAPDCDGFEVETLINIRAARANLLVREVPSFEDGWRVLRTIATERFSPRVRNSAALRAMHHAATRASSHEDERAAAMSPRG
jgi:glycosyltransferase involved in cell wall biosynthesis